ncbi:MAG: Hpt domain-containing protein [Phycisphaerales bacterium]|nr:Hpt domain-containing protein [Phycisphaerales bacterium]
MSTGQNQSRDPIPSELVQDDESFIELVQEFVDGLGARMSELEHAVQAQNMAELRALSHTLKGTAGGYGYPTLTTQAAQLEACALEGQVDAAREAFDTLQDMVSRVVIR